MKRLSPPVCDTEPAARAPAGGSAGVEEPPVGLHGILLEPPRVSEGLPPEQSTSETPSPVPIQLPV